MVVGVPRGSLREMARMPAWSMRTCPLGRFAHTFNGAMTRSSRLQYWRTVTQKRFCTSSRFREKQPEICLQAPRSISVLSRSNDVGDVLQIVSVFSMARRRHGMLFRGLQKNFLKNIELWPSQGVAEIVSDWRRVGYLREDFLLPIASYTHARRAELSLSSTILFLDGFAARRFYIRNVIDSLAAHASTLLCKGHNHRFCEVVSCCARLDLVVPSIVKQLQKRFSSSQFDADSCHLTARDVAMLAYSLQKMNVMCETSFQSIMKLFRSVHRDFVASELSIVAMAVSTSSFRDASIVDLLCRCAAVRVSQFSGVHMALLLRSLAIIEFPVASHSMVLRFVGELPRVFNSASRADICVILAALQNLSVRSEVVEILCGRNYGCIFLSAAEKKSIELSMHELLRGHRLILARDDSPKGCKPMGIRYFGKSK